MNTNLKTVVILLLFAVAVVAQQPNIPGQHFMTINGVDGPPYPIVNNPVRTALPAAFSIWGAPNQPYAIFQGNLQTGSTIVVNSIVDLALTPFPVVVVDGFVNSFFNTGPTGIGGFNVTVPPTGTPPNGVPVGLQLTLQTLMGDPFNAPFGVALTAATKITTTQGPTVNYYSLGDDSTTTVTPGFQIPFYGSNYGSFFMNSNGYLTFGTSDGSDYTPTAGEMNAGPPRFATFWCDLNCGANAVRVTTDTNPGVGVPKWSRVDYINVTDLGGAGFSHNFGMLMRDDGYLELINGSNNASQFDQISGIGPGSAGGTQPQINFVGPPAIASLGGPILPNGTLGNVNQAFFEWFGNLSMPYYGNNYNNYYDMPGVIVRFAPGGGGTLPGASNRYQVY
jgi:hypothetical protein